MAEKKKMPEIRFKGFDDDWDERELGEIGYTYTGLSGKTKDDFGHGHGEFVTYMNVFSNPVSNRSTTEPIEIDKKQNEVKAGDVFFTTSSETPEEVGMSSVWLQSIDNVYLNSFCFGYRPVEKFDIYYTAYMLRSPLMRKKITFLAQGISRYNISKNKVMEITIPKPSIDEQSKIGTYFKQLDSLITLNQRKYDKLVNVKKSMLEKMFPKNGATVPEIRFKGFAGSWEERKLGEMADFSKGHGYSKNDLVEVGSPIILYGRLYTKYQTVISEVDTFVLDNNVSFCSKGNEVIVPASGETAEDIARASAVVKSGILLGGDLNIIYPNDYINSIFLAFSISNGKPQKELAKKAQGKSVVHLRNADLKEVEIQYPSKKEQIIICKYFQKLDHLLTLHQRELEKLKNIKKAMLEKMFV